MARFAVVTVFACTMRVLKLLVVSATPIIREKSVIRVLVSPWPTSSWSWISPPFLLSFSPCKVLMLTWIAVFTLVANFARFVWILMPMFPLILSSTSLVLSLIPFNQCEVCCYSLFVSPFFFCVSMHRLAACSSRRISSLTTMWRPSIGMQLHSSPMRFFSAGTNSFQHYDGRYS